MSDKAGNPNTPQNNTGTGNDGVDGGDQGDPKDTKDTDTSWITESLSEDFHENEDLQGFESPDDLAKAYLENKDRLDGLPQVPESPDGYEIDTDETNEELVGKFKGLAHEMGLSQEQAAKLVEWNNGMLAQLTEDANTQHKEAMESLKKEWGGDWNQNVDHSRKAVGMVEQAVPGLKAFLDNTGLGDNPMLIRAFSEIGKRMDEGSLVESDTSPARKTTVAGRPMLNFPSMKE